MFKTCHCLKRDYNDSNYNTLINFIWIGEIDIRSLVKSETNQYQYQKHAVNCDIWTNTNNSVHIKIGKQNKAAEMDE